MAIQTVRFEYDAERNILFTEDDYSLSSEQDVDDFIRLNQEKLESLGRRVYMVSKIDGLHIGAQVSEYFGQRAREVFQKYILGFARYGENPAARMTVRTSSKKAKLESNICNTREEAIRVIKQIMKGSGPENG